MKLLENFKRFTPIEIGLLIIFVIYIIFPIRTPQFLSGAVDSSLGMITIFCITVFLFLYTHPILAVLYIFVAYELIRRSSEVTARTAIIQYTPSQDNKDAELKALNPPQPKTLEEEVIEVRAPIGQTQILPYVNSDFKPVADKTVPGASLIL